MVSSVSSMAISALLLAAGARYTDPEKTDADFAWQGEFVGSLSEADVSKIGLQVIALGGGEYRGVAYRGGLPGRGWDGSPPESAAAKRAEDHDSIRFVCDGYAADVTRAEASITRGEKSVGTLTRITRESPTVKGFKRPKDAIVLFDGSQESLKNWQNGRMTEDGLLMEGTTSRDLFEDHYLHLEFRLAYQPADRGQARSNSGVYLQGRYEVQILDSFGLEGQDNECGGIYSVSRPRVNMCFPPLQWQTYDIEFRSARFDGPDKKVVAAPRISVWHNGELIHDNVELPADRSTTAAPLPAGTDPGPVYLQDHGCPVRFRNIWVIKR